jgi:hypothetical protein
VSWTNPTLPPLDRDYVPLDEGALFTHRPLRLDVSSIRLIDVLPPCEYGTIRCKIRHETLRFHRSTYTFTQSPINLEYTCLSYVWGPVGDPYWIYVNDKPFRVGKALWDFLRVASIRPPDGHAPIRPLNRHERERSIYSSLWIDAICIDQNNVLERNHQVQQMGQIYAGALMFLRGWATIPT